MDMDKIILNSFKCPFRNLKELAILCILFILLLVLPIGFIIGQEIVQILGVVAIIIFALLLPGYLLSVVRSGTMESSSIPLLKPRNIVDTFKLLVLRIIYMIIPVLVFLILVWVFGSLTIQSVFNLNFSSIISYFVIVCVICSIVYVIFVLLSIIAKARLAYTNSLREALKIHKVIKDIRNIGFAKTIVWFLVIEILLGFISGILFIALLFVHYVGIVIYGVIVLPIILIIYYYSLGLLYSDISEEKISDDDLDLEKFEKEIKKLKYGF